MSFTRTLRAVGGAAMAGALLLGTAPVASADSIRDSQWALNSFSAEKVWSVSTGKGVTVAVIDNGVNGDHPDLKGNVLSGKNFSTGDAANQETKNSHGTSMASIIAGHGHGPGNSEGVMGLAPDAKILPLKYSDSDATTFSNTTFAEPLRYAVDHGATVVNMSIASPVLTDEDKQAIAYAVKHDVLMVGGAGNSGKPTIEYPAGAEGVVAVGAVGQGLKIWGDSNYGSHLLLSAPGQEITTANVTGGYVGSKGTSDATAYVSAAAALLRSKFPNLTAGQIVNRLTKTALVPDGVSKTPDAHYGYGIIRPYRALTDNIPAGSENGPLTLPDLSSVSDSPSAGSSTDNSAAESNDTGKTILGVAGFVLIVLIILVVIIVVVAKRKNRRNGPPPGSGGPDGPGGGWGAPGDYPQQAGPPAGYPQHQPNPYASQQQPPNQWPSQ